MLVDPVGQRESHWLPLERLGAVHTDRTHQSAARAPARASSWATRSPLDQNLHSALGCPRFVLERGSSSGPTRVARLNVRDLWFTDGFRLREVARRGRRCVECGKELPTRRTPYCSRRCRWSFHGRYFWDAARRAVIHRDRFRCRACGTRCPARLLDVDHIVELAVGGEALDSANLQTLCRPCHRRKTAGFLRSRASVRSSPLKGDQGSVGVETPEWFPA